MEYKLFKLFAKITTYNTNFDHNRKLIILLPYNHLQYNIFGNIFLMQSLK